MNTKKIPFSPPDVGAAEAQEVTQTLLSGWITTGPRTKEFEREIAAYCHTEKAVCLNSATACMEMILRVLGVGPGDEVITSAYTYTATASVTCHVGAKVVLVDTAPGSFEMDYDKLADAITEKTKVVIPVDLAGIVCDYDRIFAAVESRKQLFRPTNELQKAFGRVIVLADAAHAFGAKRAGRVCGEIADFTSFSFHAVKNLTTAEGGALTWRNIPGIDNEWLYKQFQLLSLHGQSKDALAKTQLGAWEYDIVSPAYKCNMTDIMAGIGLVQLKRYPELLKRRREIIERYDKALRRLNVQVLDHYGSAHASSGHLYLVRLLGKDVAERNDFITRMAERGIACNVHYKPLPMMTAYKALGFDIEDYPNAYDMYRNEVTLPLHTRLTDEDIDYVLTNFTEILSKSTHRLKRTFDLIASSLGLLLLSPLFLMLAIWIKIDSEGPVFYRQVRVGKGNRDFRLFKFRSMRVGSDQKGLITVGGRDPRVTRSGYYIRKYKLDELPQLINVFIGDMSLVGPRPEVRKYVDLYTPEQMHVLDVRPGITDLASIRYRNENELLAQVEDPDRYYVEVIMQDKLRINLEYAQHHSFAGDIQLIFRTFRAILR